jgi:hypothetical protein
MSAAYYRGFLLEANTNNATKVLNVRDSDTGALHAFTGGPSANNINHAGQSQIEYTFTTPFISHLVRDEPGNDGVQWQRFGIKWTMEPVPELTNEASQFLNFGIPGAKYMRGAVLPMDTNGLPVSLTFSSDGNNQTVGPFTTPAAVKTAQPFAFTIPLIGHEYQIKPSAPVRLWLNEARWDFDPWPELINESTGWMNVLPGGAAAFLQGLLLPVEANGATLNLSVLTDISPTPIPLIPVRVPLPNVKTPVPYSLATPVVCHQVQILVDAGTPAPSGGCVVWIPTTTPPDGVRTQFYFPTLPVFTSWNGLVQFQGFGYTLSIISGNYVVTFRDASGNVLAPQAGDVIMAETA